jgi:hypothetical protein
LINTRWLPMSFALAPSLTGGRARRIAEAQAIVDPFCSAAGSSHRAPARSSHSSPALLAALIVSQTFNASHPGLTIDDRAAGLAVALLAALARLPMLAVIALAAVATAVTGLIL